MSDMLCVMCVWKMCVSDMCDVCGCVCVDVCVEDVCDMCDVCGIVCGCVCA